MVMQVTRIISREPSILAYTTRKAGIFQPIFLISPHCPTTTPSVSPQISIVDCLVHPQTNLTIRVGPTALKQDRHFPTFRCLVLPHSVPNTILSYAWCLTPEQVGQMCGEERQASHPPTQHIQTCFICSLILCEQLIAILVPFRIVR
jgi:hypothetical protein